MSSLMNSLRHQGHDWRKPRPVLRHPVADRLGPRPLPDIDLVRQVTPAEARQSQKRSKTFTVYQTG